MSVPLVINGVTYQYPQPLDKNWGPVLTNWSTAVTNGMLQKAGGSFTLTNAVDFGPNFGISVKSIMSEETNPALTGFLRLGNASPGLVWRNAANSADLPLTVNASNQLTFNGTSIGATTSLTNSHILVGNTSNQPADVALSGDATITNAGVLTVANSAITNAKIAASTGITLTKLAALSASIVPVTDGSGFLTSSSTTATELGYVHGVTSAIQTQLATLTSSLSNYLPLAGGTMSGTLNMGSNVISSVTQGSTTGQAISFPVGTAQISANSITQTVQSVSTDTDGVGQSYTTLTTASITTTGGPIIVMAHADITIFAAALSVHYEILRGATLIDGGAANVVNFVSGSSNQHFPISINTIDSPVAGTYTYTLQYAIANGSGPSVRGYTLSLIELKR